MRKIKADPATEPTCYLFRKDFNGRRNEHRQADWPWLRSWLRREQSLGRCKDFALKLYLTAWDASNERSVHPVEGLDLRKALAQARKLVASSQAELVWPAAKLYEPRKGWETAVIFPQIEPAD